MKINYYRIDLYKSNYGGRHYERMIDDCLSNMIECYYIFNNKNKLGIIFKILYNLIKLNFFSKKNHLLTFQTIPFINLFKKNILIIHHIDIRYSSLLMRLYYYYCFICIYLFKSRISKIVVVSKYWKDYLEKRGFTNVQIIYNSFDTSNFHISEDEVRLFKLKYKLDLDKPIIYVGNIISRKGFDKVFDLLKNESYTLVGSGTNHYDVDGLICFNLSYREYLILLKSSDLILLMSEFIEGWNRTAHEAILLNKKVIGSGSGGMRELLQTENRIIANNYDNFNSMVRKELKNNNKDLAPITIQNYNKKYFEKKWLNVLN